MRVIGSNAYQQSSGLTWCPKSSSECTESSDSYLTCSGRHVVSRNIRTLPTCDVPLETSGSVNASNLEVSLEGSLVAFVGGSPGPTITVISASNKAVLHRFGDHDHGVSGLAISHDNKYLMSIGDPYDRKVIVYDLENGNINANTIVGTNQAIHSVISGGFVMDIKNRPTLKYMFVSCGLNHINVWEFDPETRQLDWRSVVGRHVREFTCVCVIQGMLFAGTTTGDIISVTLKSLTVSANTTPLSGSGGICCMVSDHSHHVVVGSVDGSITIFKVEKSQLIQVQKLFLEKNSAISSISLKTKADGLHILACNKTGSEFFIDPKATTIIRQIPHHRVAEILFLEKSQRILVASSDIHNSFDLGVSWSRFYSASPSLATCCAANSNLVLAGYSEQIVGIDSKTGSYLWSIPFEAKPARLDMSLAKHYMLAGSQSGDVCLYDLRSKQMKSRSKECISQITGLKFFPGDQFAISSGGRSLVTYDMHIGKRITHHRERNLGINGFVLFPDQTCVATIGAEKVVSFWDLRVHEPINIVPTVVEFTAVALNEPHIAFGAIDGNLAIWDCRKSDWVIAPISSNTTNTGQRINAIQFLKPNQVMTGGNDNCVTIHDPFMDINPTPLDCCQNGGDIPTVGKLDLSCVTHAE